MYLNPVSHFNMFNEFKPHKKNKAALVTLYTDIKLLPHYSPTVHWRDQKYKEFFFYSFNSLLCVRSIHLLSTCSKDFPHMWKQFVLLLLILYSFFSPLGGFSFPLENKREAESHAVSFNPHLILRCYHSHPASYSLPSGKQPMWWAADQSGVGRSGSGDICLDLDQGCH